VKAPAVLERRSAELGRVREALVIVLIVTIPLAIGSVVWAAPGANADFNRRVSISPFDVPLALLLVLALIDRATPSRTRLDGWTRRIAIALAVVILVALVAHPSPRGFDFAFRVASALAVVHALRRLGAAARRRVLAVLVGTATVEAVIALLQSAHGGGIGVGALEFSGFFYRFGSSTAATAGFDHPYHLACFLLVAIGAALLGALGDERRTPWLIGVGVIAAGLATTYSRGVLVTLVVLLGILLFARGPADRRRVRRAFAAVVAGGFLLVAVAFGDGYIARGQTTSEGHVSSYRTDRAREAIRMTRAHPVLGVGPGRYTIALESIEHTDLLPAHDAVLQEAAEAGVLAGVLTAALLLAMAVRSVRGGPEMLFVFAALIIFFVIDAYPYTFPTGMATTGLWLGLLEFTPSRHATGVR
jgi:hypothetical protein